MRRRSFVPEAPGRLEDRSSPSSVAGGAVEPVVFPIRRLQRVLVHVTFTFGSYTRFRQEDILRDELRNDVISVPFARVDGLGEVIDDSVERMQSNNAAHVPFAIRTAQREVIAAIREDLAARVQAGDVILR